jgi:hypothetical protein
MADTSSPAVTSNPSAPAPTNIPASAEVKADVKTDAPLTPKMIKSLKIKVDNQEYDEALPFEVDENNKEHVEYLKRNLQMSKAASKRMQEASLTKKQAQDFVAMLQQDPMKVLSDPRVMGEEKFRAIAEAYLTKKIQEQQLTPEQRKSIEMQEKLRNYEENEKKQKDEVQAKQVQQLEEHYAQEYQKTIITALQSSNLPKNPFTVKRMAELMSKNIQHGLELEPNHLAQLVREDYQKELAALIGGSDPDQIIAMFGDEMTNKIRKADLAKLKASQLAPQVPRKTNNSIAQSEGRQKMRPDEYEAYLKNRK